MLGNLSEAYARLQADRAAAGGHLPSVYRAPAVPPPAAPFALDPRPAGEDKGEPSVRYASPVELHGQRKRHAESLPCGKDGGHLKGVLYQEPSDHIAVTFGARRGKPDALPKALARGHSEPFATDGAYTFLPPILPRRAHARCSKHNPHMKFGHGAEKVSETEFDRAEYGERLQTAIQVTHDGRERARAGAGGDLLAHQAGGVPRGAKFSVGGVGGAAKVGANSIDKAEYRRNARNAITTIAGRNCRNRSKVSVLLEGRAPPFGQGAAVF